MVYSSFCRLVLWLAVLIALWSSGLGYALYAQDTTQVIQPLPLPATPDTVVAAADTVKQTFSPNKALLLSFVPGGGQWYNQQRWKTPLFAGSVAALGAATLVSRLQYNRYYNQYNKVLTNYASGIDDNTNLQAIQQKKQQSLRQFNLALNAMFVMYGVNLVDAYMNAHIKNDRLVPSPIRAAYRAMVAPGWGQATNKKYWKIPIVYAGFAAAGAGFYLNRKEYLRYKNEYLARTRPGFYAPNNPDPSLAFLTDNNILIGRKNVYRRYVEISIIGGTLWYAVTVLDALIDAHLSDFDVSDDLSFRVSPFFTPDAASLGVSGSSALGLSFNLTLAHKTKALRK